MYPVCTKYIPVWTWIATHKLASLSWVTKAGFLRRGWAPSAQLPNSFWRYYVFTFDNGKGYCVYWTGLWWCLKTKTVSDFMAIIHVIVPVQTQYIPVHTGMYHFRHYVPLRTWYRPVHTGMYQKPWFRTTSHDSRCKRIVLCIANTHQHQQTGEYLELLRLLRKISIT